MGNITRGLLRPGRDTESKSFFELERVSWFDRGDHGRLHLGNVCLKTGETVVLGYESGYKHGNAYMQDISGAGSDRAIVQKVGGQMVGLMNGQSITMDGAIAPLPSCRRVSDLFDLPDIPDVTIGEVWNIEGQTEDDQPVAAVWFDAKKIYLGDDYANQGLLLPVAPPFREFDELITRHLIDSGQY